MDKAMNFKLIFCAVCLLYDTVASHNMPEDGRLNFTQLANKYGQSVEEFDVVTEDGYILKLFHIPGNRSEPVLLMHGIFDSSNTFIIRGYTSLAIALANQGYDVWAGNCRGNKYSNRHTNLSTSDIKFWDFSFHEMGVYDLPATIDFVLNQTGKSQLRAFGHSQGNQIFYVLGAMRPEYNAKIKVMTALAPICFLNNLPPPVSILGNTWPLTNTILAGLGEQDLFAEGSVEKNVSEIVCTNKLFGYKICAEATLFPYVGPDPEELEPEFFPVVIGQYPTGTSKKNLMHTTQVARRKQFARYDYGPLRNLEMYGSVNPPVYDLSKVTMPIVLFAAKNDRLSTLADVELLKEILPNVVEYRLMERKLFNHLDHVWGRNMVAYLFPHIFDVLKKF